MSKLFVVFVVMPIVEILVLLEVSEHIGGWTTIGIIVFTAVVGSHLVKQQGLQTFQSAQIKLQQGHMPETELLEGFLILVAGILLVTPGFVTDFFGLLCLIPVTRHIIAKAVVKSFKTASLHAHFQSQTYTNYRQAPFNQSAQTHESHNVYEGEVVDQNPHELEDKSKKE